MSSMSDKELYDKIFSTLEEWENILGSDAFVLEKDLLAEYLTQRTMPPSGLETIAKEIRNCRKCKLHESRVNPVPGEGNPNPRILFIGEAPGKEEDAHGRPFIGPAGNLLTAMIEKGMKVKRESVYITNIVKCRPPGNRDPDSDEIQACLPFLMRQIDTLKPEVIICLGRIAAKTMLQTIKPLNMLRGKPHLFKGIPLVVTWHPSYLLRYPKQKRGAWEDLKMAMRILGLPF